MKKLLIGVGSVLIMAFVLVLFVNAKDTPKDPKKAKTETVKTEAPAPCSATCSSSKADAAAKCDPATCTAHKEGEKCDPATCIAHAEAAKKEAEACKPTAGCAATCPMSAKK